MTRRKTQSHRLLHAISTAFILAISSCGVRFARSGEAWGCSGQPKSIFVCHKPVGDFHRLAHGRLCLEIKCAGSSHRLTFNDLFARTTGFRPYSVKMQPLRVLQLVVWLATTVVMAGAAGTTKNKVH